MKESLSHPRINRKEVKKDYKFWCRLAHLADQRDDLHPVVADEIKEIQAGIRNENANISMLGHGSIRDHIKGLKPRVKELFAQNISV